MLKFELQQKLFNFSTWYSIIKYMCNTNKISHNLFRYEHSRKIQANLTFVNYMEFSIEYKSFLF